MSATETTQIETAVRGAHSLHRLVGRRSLLLKQLKAVRREIGKLKRQMKPPPNTEGRRTVGSPFPTPPEGQVITAETKYHGTVTGTFNRHRWKYDDHHWWERKRVLIGNADAIPWRQVEAWRKAPNAELSDGGPRTPDCK